MSRREQAERLLDAIGEIQYELVEAAAQPQRKKNRSLGVIAAVILLALLVPTIPIAVNFLVGSGHFGADESGANVLGNAYAAYQGPVFPLTVVGEIGDIAASRQVTLDFSDYTGDGYADGNKLAVIDAYTLQNSGSTEQSLTLRYPYQSDGMREMAGEAPEIQVDGRRIESRLLASQNKTLGTSSWGDYITLMDENPAPSISLSADTPVTLYEFSDIRISGSAGQRYQMELQLDPSADGVFVSGPDGAERTGEETRLYTGTQQQVRVAVLHGTLASHGLFAYGNREETAQAQLRSEETTLGEVLREMIPQDITWPQKDGEARWLETTLMSGPLAWLSTKGDGLLSVFLSELEGESRIFYREFQVVVPANGSLRVSVQQIKHPSKTLQDGPEAQEAGEGADGYDVVTTLGTRLPITRQQGILTNYDAVEIKDQNFGFAPEQGITEITLKPEKQEYYINVVKKQ